jgi:gas vesicle protein
MAARDAGRKIAENGWVRLGTVLLIGLGGGAGGTTLLAQPRTDKEIRDIAKEEVTSERRVVTEKIENLKADVDEIKNDMKEVLRRLPRPGE